RPADRAPARRAAVALRAGRARHRPGRHHRRAGRQDRGLGRPGSADRRTGGPPRMSSTSVTVDREGTVTGNTYDKYGSTNPVVRRLMSGVEATLDELFVQAAPQSILDVGCGEGVLTEKWARRLGDKRVVGIDLDDPALHAEWEKRTAPNLEYRVMNAEKLPFADGEFDVATAIEVLEHVPDPEHTVAAMARVARRALLVSAPCPTP